MRPAKDRPKEAQNRKSVITHKNSPLRLVMTQEQVITISCKMKVSEILAKQIDETLAKFSCACEWVNANTPEGLTNKTGMQSLVYKDVRDKFGLSSNLAIQAIRRVCANRKTAKLKNRKVKGFAPTSPQLLMMQEYSRLRNLIGL